MHHRYFALFSPKPHVACITIPMLQMRTLRPREVTQDHVVSKLADLGKLGLGPTSACLQSRFGHGC